MDHLTRNVASAATAFLRERRGKRVHPTTVRIGALDGPHIGLPHDPGMDVGLRTDLVARALDGFDPSGALTWLTRGGPLDPVATAFAWLVAAREGFARHGVRLPAFVVITTEGWFDLVNDVTVRHTDLGRSA